MGRSVVSEEAGAGRRVAQLEPMAVARCDPRSQLLTGCGGLIPQGEH